MLRSTCGERKLCSTIKKSKNIMNMIGGPLHSFTKDTKKDGTFVKHKKHVSTEQDSFEARRYNLSDNLLNKHIKCIINLK